MTRALGSLAGLLAMLALAGPAAAAPAVSGEFQLLSEIGSNNKLTEGPDGNIWVTIDASAANNDVARVTPAGVVTEFDLGALTNVSGIARDAEGRLWVTSNEAVTSFLPANPAGTKSTTAIAQVMGFHSIAFGLDGNLWVATDGFLLKVPPTNPGAKTLFPVAGLSPRDIDAAGSLLAIADSTGKRILLMTTAGTVAGEYKLTGGSQGVAGAPSGQIAFSQQTQAPTEIGLATPFAIATMTPSPLTDPFGVAYGSDGAFWIAQVEGNSLTRLTADNQAGTLTGFANLARPRQIAPGPDNTLWVTLDTSDRIGRVSGLEPPAPAVPVTSTVPETTIKSGPKGKLTTNFKRRQVSFRFESPNAGASFECRLQRLPRKPIAKVSKAAVFAPCTSPRRYRLRPGRYRFDVSAVLAGVSDSSPAGRSFRIVRAPRR